MGSACANHIPFQLRLGWPLRVEVIALRIYSSAPTIMEAINTPFTIK